MYSICDIVCQWHMAGWFCSPVTPFSLTNKTDRHNMAQILLKVALNTVCPYPFGEMWRKVHVLNDTVVWNIQAMFLGMGIWLCNRDSLICRMNEWTLNGHFRYVALRHFFRLSAPRRVENEVRRKYIMQRRAIFFNPHNVVIQRFLLGTYYQTEYFLELERKT